MEWLGGGLDKEETSDWDTLYTFSDGGFVGFLHFSRLNGPGHNSVKCGDRWRRSLHQLAKVPLAPDTTIILLSSPRPRVKVEKKRNIITCRRQSCLQCEEPLKI